MLISWKKIKNMPTKLELFFSKIIGKFLALKGSNVNLKEFALQNNLRQLISLPTHDKDNILDHLYVIWTGKWCVTFTPPSVLFRPWLSYYDHSDLV